MEPQQYLDLVKLLQQLLENQKTSKEKLKQELASCQRELAMANALIASKDETITLLRGSYNRPN